MTLNDKRVLITGGTRGLGRAIAMDFAKHGARVALSYHHDEASAAETRTVLKEVGGDCLILKADVASQEAVTHLWQSIMDRWQGIDILINSAGMIRDKMLMFLEPADWERVLAVNLTGTYLCSRAVLKSMIGQRYGRIVNMTSPSALTGRAGQTNYAAAKGGVIAFTKSLSKETARLGITVNAICPGVITTPMTEALTSEQKAALMALIPMGRFGNPDDIAKAALFLASEDAGYITGQVLAVDGGLV